MKVLKFGGTSVGTPESLRCVKSIVESQSEPCIVVVSALGGITDRLLAASAMASTGDIAFETEFKNIVTRHHEVIRSVVPQESQEALTEEVDLLFDELHTVCKAIFLLNELSERSRDLVVSFGERISSRIVQAMIPGSARKSSLRFIRTQQKFGRNVLDAEKSAKLIDEELRPIAQANRVVIVPGFISRDSESHITNLGRGGSDYTAAILAAHFGANVLEIWTDVNGFMTADPRIVKDAQIIDRLSFVEAMELCNFGAKVVYPPTIYPVFHANIPILIKNTFNAAASGTLIAENTPHSKCHGIIGVSSIAQSCLVRMHSDKFVWPERMINALTRNGIETLMADNEGNCGIKIQDAQRAGAVLSDEFAAELTSGEIERIEILKDLSTVAIVAAGTQRIEDAPTRLASSLNCEGIPVVHSPRQASPGVVACMIASNYLNQALNAIHSTFIR